MKNVSFVLKFTIFVIVGSACLLWGLHVKRKHDAIELVKSSKTLSNERNNEDYIRHWLGEAKGKILVGAWKAQMAKDGVYLVTLDVEDNGGAKGFAFEVLTAPGIVRDVFDSPALVMEYGFPVLNAPIGQELANRVADLTEKKGPPDLVIMEAGDAAVLGAPSRLVEDREFFLAYLRITDALSMSGNRFILPTPQDFIEERRAQLAQYSR